MSSFIEQFFEDVDFNLNDPTTSKRTTKAKKLRLLTQIDHTIWEKVLQLTGQDSMAGYAEREYTLESERKRYPLPEHFRHFFRFELRDSTDSRHVLNFINSVQYYDLDPGLVILTAERGMLMKPPLTLSDDLNPWTLVYLRSPGKLHYATAKEATATTLTAGVPGPDAGEIIKLPNYYNGALLRVYDADEGAEQIREILSWNPESGTFVLRNAWDVIPKGNIRYEIRPTLPPEFQDLYAIDVALRILGSRRRGRQQLERDRKTLWAAANSYFTSNVADRPPGRIHPDRGYEMDPYFGT